MTRLLEKSRGELLSKSQNADATKSYGTTRYIRRVHTHVINSSDTFNTIDMNSLFKGDVLLLKIPVQGETNRYEVDIVFDGVVKDISRELKKNNYNLEYKIVYKAIIRAINNQNIYIGCTCGDWRFRFAYHATKNKFNAGRAQVVPANKTNPNDSQGAGCKHVMNVLANLDWALKLATVIFNYIIYMDQNMHDKYETIIFPILYNMTYKQALAKGIIETPEDEEEPDEEIPDEVENDESEPLEDVPDEQDDTTEEENV